MMGKKVKNLMVAGLGTGLSQGVLSEVKAGMKAGSPEYTAIDKTQAGMSKISNKFPVIGSIYSSEMVLKSLGKLNKGKKK